MQDILLHNGTITIGESTQTHISDTLIAGLGHYKLTPIYGVAGKRLIAGHASPFLLQALRIQLRSQSITIDNMHQKNEKINITL